MVEFLKNFGSKIKTLDVSIYAPEPIKVWGIKFINLAKKLDLETKLWGVFSSLPIFFGWLPIFTWKYKNKYLMDIAVESMVAAFFFWFGIFIASILHWIPWIGGYVSNGLHLILIVLYFSFSIYSIYTIVFNKERKIPYLIQLRSFLSQYIQPVNTN